MLRSPNGQASAAGHVSQLVEPGPHDGENNLGHVTLSTKWGWPVSSAPGSTSGISNIHRTLITNHVAQISRQSNRGVDFTVLYGQRPSEFIWKLLWKLSPAGEWGLASQYSWNAVENRRAAWATPLGHFHSTCFIYSELICELWNP